MRTDYVPIKSYTTNVVTLGVGQRVDVLVKANGQPTDAVLMRSQISPKCTADYTDTDTVFNGTALAAIFYENANRTAVPTSSLTPYDDSICGNVSQSWAISTDCCA